MKTEAKIQQEIVMWYRNNYGRKGTNENIIFSVPNESKSKRETLQKKAIGMMSGVSDLIVIEKKEVIFIEVKTPTGVQSKTQKQFQDQVENLGYRYILVRSLQDFKDAIQ